MHKHSFTAPAIAAAVSFGTLGLQSVVAAPVTTAPASATTPNRVPARTKKIFAHYMGCWPTASGPIVHDFQNAKNLRHDAPGETEKLGGHVRNWTVPQPDTRLSLYESCDLEIRRAMRVGIDGFTIDAWAGGQSAKDTLNMLFKVAEEKDYPFEITITPDPNALDANAEGSKSIVDTIKYLLARHGKSPKLARRDGKPLIFGYQSIWYAVSNGDVAYAENPEAKGTWIWDKPEWRSTPKGWEYMGKAMKTLEEKVGQPLYMEFCMSAFNYNIKGGGITPAQNLEAAGIIAKYVGAVGSFNWMGNNQSEIAKTIISNGAEWVYPIGLGQKENIPYESYGAPGLEWFHGGWKGVIGDKSTLLQYITWNDYGENSAMAPAFNTRYALYDLTGYYIDLWKQGKPPVYDRDKLYLAYRKYPKGSKLYPFRGKFPRDKEPALEVVTILTKPAKIRLVGRGVEYDAPAGFHNQQFPNTPGAVIAEIVRANKVTERVESPEPITDKPFREDNGFVAFSSEDARHWKSDFGNTPMWTYSEYGDEDKDGLPNWFEMYWFGTWMDFSTMSVADPKADPDRDGKNNLQEYQEQTDPTLSPAEEKMVGKLPLAYLRNRARGMEFQPGKITVPFKNGSFEAAGADGPTVAEGWVLKAGAERSREKASAGQWSIKLPGGPGMPQSHITQGVASHTGYAWNNDPLHPNAVRAGSVVGYSVDVALEKDGARRQGYMRLAHDPNAGGYEMWGGIPMISATSARFSTRHIAHRLGAKIWQGGGMGGSWAHQSAPIPEVNAMYFDNFSPLTVLNARLKVSHTGPLSLGGTAVNTAVTSPAITISNGQLETLPQQLNEADAPTQVATILYGLANLKPDAKGFAQSITAATDHVGATIIGDKAHLFELVSEYPGDTKQQLKLMGDDSVPGLRGGPQAEKEEFQVRFTGAPQPGKYAATLRIVTQAANAGTLSLLKPGEPPYNLFYVDIPVEVTVG